MTTHYLSLSTISFSLYSSPLQDFLQTDLSNSYCISTLWSLLKAQWESMPFYLKAFYKLCSPYIFSRWGPEPFPAYLNWLSFELCQTAEQPSFIWSPTTADLMAARDREAAEHDSWHQSENATPWSFTLSARANLLMWPPWEFKGANAHRHTKT